MPISQPGSGASLPTGTILMWYGTIATIPGGYVFCDGTNSTPDLRDRIIIGASTDSGGQPKATMWGQSFTILNGSTATNDIDEDPGNGSLSVYTNGGYILPGSLQRAVVYIMKT